MSPFYETGEHGGQHYFSMEYVPGRDLGAIVRDAPLPAKRAAGYVQRIAQAIHYAHQQGTLHRDLKPSNVLSMRTTSRGSPTSAWPKDSSPQT